MSLRSKQYIIPLKPTAWSRAGVNHREKRFFDMQLKEKERYICYLSQQHGNDLLFEGPLELDVIFHMPIPKTKANRRPYPWHDSVPDLDNLEKLLQDAITASGVIWKDDRQVAKKNTQKIYHPTTELIIKITELI